jgi:hypothetical protein
LAVAMQNKEDLKFDGKGVEIYIDRMIDGLSKI